MGSGEEFAGISVVSQSGERVLRVAVQPREHDAVMSAVDGVELLFGEILALLFEESRHVQSLDVFCLEDSVFDRFNPLAIGPEFRRIVRRNALSREFVRGFEPDVENDGNLVLGRPWRYIRTKWKRSPAFSDSATPFRRPPDSPLRPNRRCSLQACTCRYRLPDPERKSSPEAVIVLMSSAAILRSAISCALRLASPSLKLPVKIA